MRGLVTTALIGTWLLATAGCGTSVSTRPAALRTGAITPASVPGVTDRCSSVTVTTRIDRVTAACQAVWWSYGVTAVPPSNELALEHVPNAPPVVNMTDGAVPDTTAQHWADASNRDSGWWQWAQAHDQLFVLRHLVGPSLIPATEVEALQNGGTVEQPACNLYPISWKLFPVGVDGRAYFARKRLPAGDDYVFVVVYSGPCSETLRDPQGHPSTLVDFTENTTVLSPGALRRDPVLGDIWFADAGGNCQDPSGPPAAWCGR